MNTRNVLLGLAFFWMLVIIGIVGCCSNPVEPEDPPQEDTLITGDILVIQPSCWSCHDWDPECGCIPPQKEEPNK